MKVERLLFLFTAIFLNTNAYAGSGYGYVKIPMGGCNLPHSVTKIGDVDRDGVSDFAVGCPAPWDHSGGNIKILSGRDFHVMTEVGSDVADQNFGFSLSDIGNVNGDEFPDLLVGAPGKSTYQCPQNSWAPYGYAAILLGPGFTSEWGRLTGARNSMFGSHVENVGNLDSWSANDFVVTAAWDMKNYPNDPCSTIGSAQYTVSSTSPLQVLSWGRTPMEVRRTSRLGTLPGHAKPYYIAYDAYPLVIVDGATGNVVQSPTLVKPVRSVDEIGDIDGDGYPDFLVGGGVETWEDQDPGSVTVYHWNSQINGYEIYANHTVQGAPGDKLGSAVVGLNDVDGDGVNDFAAISASTTEGSPPHNYAYVRVYSTNKLGTANQVISYALTDGELNSQPPAMANLGDLDGDGKDDFAVTSSASLWVFLSTKPSAPPASLIWEPVRMLLND